MIEFYAAVARKSIKGESNEGWHPEQAVSREQGLKMFTIWPAYPYLKKTRKAQSKSANSRILACSQTTL
jgi:hypothetical protein